MKICVLVYTYIKRTARVWSATAHTEKIKSSVHKTCVVVDDDSGDGRTGWVGVWCRLGSRYTIFLTHAHDGLYYVLFIRNATEYPKGDTENAEWRNKTELAAATATTAAATMTTTMKAMDVRERLTHLHSTYVYEWLCVCVCVHECHIQYFIYRAA